MTRYVKDFLWVCLRCGHVDDPTIIGKPTICPKCGCNDWEQRSKGND